ncbi:hypothetical protein FOZ76_10105 [Verticiella sediminum]|uniref:Anti sigma-E protein RseA N-terminal domain-containing protein n=2 Tax=Verticiella sediminum TaxID=1247510 RepID=A0A556ASD3_9BURK|nr:hypothetical protein FOZ76_10105 [Verticiella sediminum]
MDGEDEMPASLRGHPGLARDWDTFHLIGDVMRSEGLAHPSGGFAERMSRALADEPAIVAPQPRPARRHGLRYVVPGAALAAAVAVVTWVAQPYIAPTTGVLQASAGQSATRTATASASGTLTPQLADYFDAHRLLAGMGGMGTQASLDVAQR